MTDRPYPRPFDEEYRLLVLQNLDILDSERAPEFDRITALAAQYFRTKIAVVSLIDSDRQWFKSCHGLDADQTSRDVAFCAHAIMSDTEAFVILDATKDKRFADNPLVADGPKIRFYAGIPLVVNDAVVGTLCIIDDAPRLQFTEDESEALRSFAHIVVDEIKLRDYVRNANRELAEQIRTAETRANSGEQAKKQFLDLVSHELRTPLAGVIGFANAIISELKGPIQPPEYLEFVQQIIENGERQLRLIDRLLELTRHGRIRLEEQHLNIGQLIDECLKQLGGQAQLNEVDIQFRQPSPAIHLSGDLDHIQQIVLELVGNAIRFTPRGGKATIEVEVMPTNAVRLSVADTGGGIDEEVLRRGQELFVQGSEGLARSHEGLGVGLPIAHKLAELHGARLSLTCPTDGGTRAELIFPPYRTLGASAPVALER